MCIHLRCRREWPGNCPDVPASHSRVLECGLDDPLFHLVAVDAGSCMALDGHVVPDSTERAVT